MMTTPLLFSYIFIGITGSITGSFINMLLYRIKKGDFSAIVTDRSMCPNCKNKLKPRHLVPIFSYLVLGGKCGFCRKKIPVHYLLVELTTTVLFLITFHLFQPLIATDAGNIYIVLMLFYMSVLSFTIFYDILYLEIADSVLLPASLVALIATIHPLTPTWSDALLGAAAICGFFLAQIIVSKGKWLGGGDLRIGLLMGLMLGLKAGITALVLSYFIGTAISLVILAASKKHDLKSAVPFGPFLALGTIVTLFWGEPIMTYFFPLMGI